MSLYYGKRDKTFILLLQNVIKIGSPKLTNILTNQEIFKMFSDAFTHETVNNKNNYEFYETLGDATLNKCVLWYISRRFPQINCPDGSDILTKLKIKTIKSESFAAIAESLDFWNFISVEESLRLNPNKKRSILEDVCEAFFGVLELAVDQVTREGMGYNICYKILSTLLDKTDIKISYDEIVDNKTRVKEIYDAYSKIMGGTIQYKFQCMYCNSEFMKSAQLDDHFDKCFRIRNQPKIYTSVAYHVSDGKSLKMASATGQSPQQAEQNTAKHVLVYLTNNGYIKNIPVEYTIFCT
jgi:dsRNA-specific ribonuclease